MQNIKALAQAVLDKKIFKKNFPDFFILAPCGPYVYINQLEQSLNVIHTPENTLGHRKRSGSGNVAYTGVTRLSLYLTP